MRNSGLVAAVLALTVSGTAMAADDARPAAVSYAMPTAPAAALHSGARRSAPIGGQSDLDDTGSTLIIAAAAGVGGYFLHDIIDDHNNHNSMSGQ